MKKKETAENKTTPKHIVEKSIRIKAGPEEVWEALTNPDLTRKYFFRSRVQSNWKTGSTITFRGRFLWMKIELKGKITKIEKGKLLQFYLQHRDAKGDDDRSHRSHVTEELTEVNGKTLLTITDDVGEGAGVEKRYNRSVKGWNKVLKGLKKLLEEKK